MTEPLRGSVWPEVPDHSVLSGRTAIISGASRGIGAAVARTLAGAGVAVVLLAKSGTGSPGRLPGVVDDVAAEINATGGRALPHVGDLRSDDDVAAAIAATVAEFGGIDIVVNNAASFDTTPTASISMKRYDLLNQINARGAFSLTRAALPHLQQSGHAHVLTISPPLTVEPRWLGPHTAYTVSKYAMSLMTLGLAAELAEVPIAANSLWPSVSVATEAIRTVLGEETATSRSRHPEVMADAALEILSRSPRDYSGNLVTDVEVLRAAGVEDLSRYLVGGGEEDLLPSWFLPES
ncbi:SDR family oxidoreductase [Dietzia psychralcaliphila]|uniref:SDR family oxidoreductase n=1 Tax=Dietzia psychralcaliphila TaxID=139021 RepID=UPI0027E12730|nr:SDR family oxidoreductase [Dietzia psychralcaliphila]